MDNKKELLNKGCSVMNFCAGFCEKWHLNRALELMILVALCFAAGRVLSYLLNWGNAEFSGFWVISSALLVHKEDTDMNFMDLLQRRLTSVALGVGVAFAVLSMFGVNYFGLLAAVLLVAWICEFFNWQKYQQLALISLAVLVVSNYLKVDVSLWASAIGRILEAAIGMLLAYGVYMGCHWCRESCANVARKR